MGVGLYDWEGGMVPYRTSNDKGGCNALPGRLNVRD